MLTETPTLNILTREIRDLLHHLEHFRDRLLQDFCLADDIVYDLIRKIQNALQSIQKVRRHLIVFILLLEELMAHSHLCC